MMIATIAAQYVQTSTYNKMYRLAQYYGQYYPESPEFISSACWADDIKSQVGVHLRGDSLCAALRRGWPVPRVHCRHCCM